MRVLQLGPYPPPHGGVQTNLVGIRQFLLRQGIPCAVINITRHRQRNADEVYYPKTALQLLRLLATLRYDVIHLHVGGMLTLRLLSLGLVCCSIPRRKTVLTFHSGGYPSTPEGRALTANSIAGFVLRRFDGVIGVNPEIMKFFCKLGISPDRMRLIPPHAFFPEESLPTDLPEPLRTFFSSHHPLLISVGLLEPEYDLPLQLQAFANLRVKFPSAGLALIGSGSLENDLRERIQAHPHAEHILLAGDVPHAATMLAISRSDVILRTTLYDGDAVSVREAVHLGTPVIATDNGMRPPGIRLIATGNLEALEQAVIEQLTTRRDPKVRSFVSEESNLRAVLDFYLELLSRNAL